MTLKLGHGHRYHHLILDYKFNFFNYILFIYLLIYFNYLFIYLKIFVGYHGY